MRLLAANMLVCIVKGCQNNFPLQIVPTRVEQEESEANVDFVLHMLPRIEYPALVQMAKEVRKRQYLRLCVFRLVKCSP